MAENLHAVHSGHIPNPAKVGRAAWCARQAAQPPSSSVHGERRRHIVVGQ